MIDCVDLMVKLCWFNGKINVNYSNTPINCNYWSS